MIRSVLFFLVAGKISVQSLRGRCHSGIRQKFKLLETRGFSGNTGFGPSAEQGTNLRDDDALVPLDHFIDKYRGVVINVDSLPTEGSEFIRRLEYSLKIWRNDNRRGVWLKLPIHLAHHIEPAVKIGFRFHHALDSYIMLTQWLPSTPCTLPPYASHQVGVGTIIRRRASREILLVQERSGPMSNTGVWKIPTGLVDSGEDLQDAAVRETREETGILTEFRGIFAFRQAHKMSFGVSDLFFLCLLDAVSDEICRDDKEILACEWHSVDMYKNQPFYANSPAYTHLTSIINDIVATNSSAHVCLEPMISLVGNRPGTTTLYSYRRE